MHELRKCVFNISNCLFEWMQKIFAFYKSKYKSFRYSNCYLLQCRFSMLNNTIAKFQTTFAIQQNEAKKNQTALDHFGVDSTGVTSAYCTLHILYVVRRNEILLSWYFAWVGALCSSLGMDNIQSSANDAFHISHAVDQTLKIISIIMMCYIIYVKQQQPITSTQKQHFHRTNNKRSGNQRFKAQLCGISILTMNGKCVNICRHNMNAWSVSGY